MNRYNPKQIEPKWQKTWLDEKIYEVKDSTNKPKKYILEYFPYPSGATMHVGHVRNYTIGDAIARFYRMNGYNVLHPMGWDAFGLPAENYAISSGISPRQAIDKNTEHFKQQLIQMGFGYDWSREIDSTDPSYYRWTQWFFLLLLKKGLAYQQESLQWWCPKDKTVLANEQVEAGLCWRCGSVVEKKALRQWFFKITDYADALDKDLDDVNWSDSIKTMQRNWIGKSLGSEVDFRVDGLNDKIAVYTTRIDTIFGATFLVLAPEHPLVKAVTTKDNQAVVDQYLKQVQSKSEIERQENRVKTGVFSGSYAVNPINNQKIPIWVADYVLSGYGTGAIMAVPAHDQRDNSFAKQFKLEIKDVVVSSNSEKKIKTDLFEGEGTLINSDRYNGKSSSEARELITAELAKTGSAALKINYKMRDWLISRQRYWGAPIPVIYCQKDGVVPVPDDQLPIVLPEMTKYEPSSNGMSPLASVPEFVNTTCPKCGGAARRETDTMDGFACSSWYFLRFADAHNNHLPFTKEKADLWLPVDDYIGGAEHAVMHLLYARFWVKVMYQDKLIDFNEPFLTLRNQGMILAENGAKMSKSKNNTVSPDELIDQGYGADAIRIMELFIGPWNQSANWSTEGLGGTYRFIQRVWNLVQEYQQRQNDKQDEQGGRELNYLIHSLIKKTSEDLISLSFNTAIAAQMECLNSLYKLKDKIGFGNKQAWDFAINTILQLLAPFAPHVTEELWQTLGHKDSIHTSTWPTHDDKYIQKTSVVIVVQINGKLKAQFEVSVGTDEKEIIELAKSQPRVASSLEASSIKKTIYVPSKLVNFVV
ncbi:MAG TPA: leucine--tRNA ligase [Candidatus Dormibacteraeota bacterium]|nr:leucine--tRNA ligase [Candidatus Dormibacteraeota bacterium]